ncbi:MAG TPA: YkgJ family cysteine cluster protein [Polyangiaceae bacterium]|nr:YkgJ family cysteine cluster protein [Polyangiaceae bacterium]
MSQKRKARRARTTTAQKWRSTGSRKDAAGRVHLTLLRDPASGREGVALTKPIFQEAWQNEIATAAANTAHALLQGKATLERTVKLARSAMSATSRLADGFLARAPTGAVACKDGCDHCCYQSVGVTPPEAFAIVQHLRQTLAPSELARVSAHITSCHERTRGLTAEARFSPDHPCPFLEAGSCSIYEVRPLSCRGMNSLDANECRSRLREPEARAAFVERGEGGHSFMEPIRGFHAVSAGMQLALAELYALDMRPLELTAAMQLLLNGPETPLVDWLNGERSLEAARGGDSTDAPGIRELTGSLAPHEPVAR